MRLNLPFVDITTHQAQLLFQRGCVPHRPLGQGDPEKLTETSLDLFFDLRDVRLDPCHVSGDIGCKAQDIGGVFFPSVPREASNSAKTFSKSGITLSHSGYLPVPSAHALENAFHYGKVREAGLFADSERRRSSFKAAMEALTRAASTTTSLDPRAP